MSTGRSGYCRHVLRIAVAQICQQLGWHAVHATPLEMLTDILERYLCELAKTTHRYSEQFGRTDPNLNDLELAFRYIGIPLGELEEYLRYFAENVPYPREVPAFPGSKPNKLHFPKPGSRELLHREEHIHDHLPVMNRDWGDESGPSPANSPKQELPSAGLENGTMNSVAEKRPFPSPEIPTPKRPRMALNLPDEAGHSQYEMTSVAMTAFGVLTPTRNQGKLPDSRTPPQNLRPLKPSSSKDIRVPFKKPGEHTLSSSTAGLDAILSGIEKPESLEKDKLKDKERGGSKERKDKRDKSRGHDRDKDKRKDHSRDKAKDKDHHRDKSRKDKKKDRSHESKENKDKQKSRESSKDSRERHKDTKGKDKHGKSSAKSSKSVSSKSVPRTRSPQTSKAKERSISPGKGENAISRVSKPARPSSSPRGKSPRARSPRARSPRGIKQEVLDEPMDLSMGKKEKSCDEELSHSELASMLKKNLKKEPSVSPEPPKTPSVPVPLKIPSPRRLHSVEAIAAQDSPEPKLVIDIANDDTKKGADKDAKEARLASIAGTIDDVLNKDWSAMKFSDEESDDEDALDMLSMTKADLLSSEDEKSISKAAAAPAPQPTGQVTPKPAEVEPGLPRSAPLPAFGSKDLAASKTSIEDSIASVLQTLSSQDSEPDDLISETTEKDEKKPKRKTDLKKGAKIAKEMSKQKQGEQTWEESTPRLFESLSKFPSFTKSTDQKMSVYDFSETPKTSPVPSPEPPVKIEKSPQRPARLTEPMFTDSEDDDDEPKLPPPIQRLKIELGKEVPTVTKIKDKHRKNKKKDKEKKKKNRDKEKEERKKKKKERAEKGMPFVPKITLKIGGGGDGSPSTSTVTVVKASEPPKKKPKKDDKPDIPRLVIKTLQAPAPPRPKTPTPPPSPPPKIPTPKPKTPTPSPSPPRRSPTPKSWTPSPPRRSPSLPAHSPQHSPVHSPSFSHHPSPSPSTSLSPPPEPFPLQQYSFPVRDHSPYHSPTPSPTHTPPRSRSPSLPKSSSVSLSRSSSVSSRLSPSRSPSPPPPPSLPPSPSPPKLLPQSSTRGAGKSTRSAPKLPPQAQPAAKSSSSSPSPTRSRAARRRSPSFSDESSSDSSPVRRSPSKSPIKKKATTSPAKKTPSPQKKATSISPSPSPPPPPPPSKPLTKAQLKGQPSPRTPKGRGAGKAQQAPADIPPMPPSKYGQKGAPKKAGAGRGSKKTTVITETVGTIVDDQGQKIWICPACALPDDGSPMIGCDDCDDWYHWPCVNITEEPAEEQDWFCPRCLAKQKTKKKGRGGRGRKRGK